MPQQIYELTLAQLLHRVNQGRASFQEEKEFEERLQKLKGGPNTKEDEDYYPTNVLAIDL